MRERGKIKQYSMEGADVFNAPVRTPATPLEALEGQFTWNKHMDTCLRSRLTQLKEEQRGIYSQLHTISDSQTRIFGRITELKEIQKAHEAESTDSLHDLTSWNG